MSPKLRRGVGRGIKMYHGVNCGYMLAKRWMQLSRKKKQKKQHNTCCATRTAVRPWNTAVLYTIFNIAVLHGITVDLPPANPCIISIVVFVPATCQYQRTRWYARVHLRKRFDGSTNVTYKKFPTISTRNRRPFPRVP